jgi:hypothetical protein
VRNEPLFEAFAVARFRAEIHTVEGFVKERSSVEPQAKSCCARTRDPPASRRRRDSRTSTSRSRAARVRKAALPEDFARPNPSEAATLRWLMICGTDATTCARRVCAADSILIEVQRGHATFISTTNPWPVSTGLFVCFGGVSESNHGIGSRRRVVPDEVGMCSIVCSYRYVRI